MIARIVVAGLIAWCSTVAVAEHGPMTWARSHPSVVSVLPTWPGFPRPGLGAPPGVAPEGSGFFWSPTDGQTAWILTAAHVVDRATRIDVRLSDGRIVPAQRLISDSETDIALLGVSIEGPSLAWTALPPQVGAHVCALGNAFGLGISLTCGVVSQVGVQNIGFNPVEDFIQTDAAVNPGASGGALVNAEGELVGMLSAIFTKSDDVNSGVNFAISTALLGRVAKRFQEQISSKKTLAPAE
ncbi:MAG: S1C family serine protease [Litorivicinaceae bacterium]